MIYLIVIYVSFQNMMNTVKQKHKIFWWIFQIFKRRSPDDIHKHKMSMGLYNGGKKHVAQLHDLHTADGESVLKRTAIAYVMY